MSQSTHSLSAEEKEALVFAARRQLTRLANSRNSRHQAKRPALARALSILQAFTNGCELHADD